MTEKLDGGGGGGWLRVREIEVRERSEKYFMWVREVYNLAQTLSGPMACAEEVSCRGRVIDGQGKGERLRSYPVLGTLELRWENQRPSEGYPQTAP